MQALIFHCWRFDFGCLNRVPLAADPKKVTAAVVTCGGLCPGLNDVVQNIVYTLDDYGVPEDQIFGIRYGLRGFLDRHAKPVQLTHQWVDGIQLKGGTVLVSLILKVWCDKRCFISNCFSTQATQ